MPTAKTPQLKNGASSLVIAYMHKGKNGIAHDLNVSKAGQLTITVVQPNGKRFKTLGRNVVVAK